MIISSGFTQDTIMSQLIEDGAVGFIQKPYRQIDLSWLIAKKLGQLG